MKAVQVRRGLTRTVLLVGRWAIKVPSFNGRSPGRIDIRGALWGLSRGIQANLSELDGSGGVGVCPVRWTLFGLVNVYPRAEHVTRELTDEDYAAIGFIGPTDNNESNVGILDGRMVWVDYDVSWNDHAPCCRRTGKRARIL